MTLTRLPALSRALSRPLRPLATAAAKAAPAAAASPRPHHAVISIAGEDRVGIVKTVTSAMTTHHANMEHSKMAILGGDFAMIVHVTLPSGEAADALHKQVQHELPGFSVSLRSTTERSAAVEEGKAVWEMRFEGPDQPGLVAAVTQALATHGANVHELETEKESAPFAGYEMFRMTGVFAVGESRFEEVADALKKVEERFGASVVLSPAEEE